MQQGTVSASWQARPEDAGAQGSPERVGTVLCGWRIEQYLGKGPVSESWLASQDGKTAVARILRAPFVADERTRAEWLRANWAANRFHHTRVAKVLMQGADEAERGGGPVIIREWAKGETLERLVSSGPAARLLDTGAALRVAGQLLDALEMAHAHGIVHGALAPWNVIVTPRGSIRLVDFACGPLSRRTGAVDAIAAAHMSAYSAPERRSGQSFPSEEADVWSIGACLHFALAGRAPDGDRTALRRLNPSVSPDLAAVIDFSLAPVPTDRYESAYAMLGDLRRLTAGRKPKLETVQAPIPPSQAMGASNLGARVSLVGGRRSLLSALPGQPTADLAPPSPPPRVAKHEARGNVGLVLALALLVGLATFVLVRERIADAPTTPPVATQTAR